MNKTLYLYSKLEYFVDKGNVIEKKYRQNFMKKILYLSNSKIEDVINILEKAEEKIDNIKYKTYLKKLVIQNTFFKKVLNYNDYLDKLEKIEEERIKLNKIQKKNKEKNFK